MASSAQSSLENRLSDIERQVARFLGWGNDSAQRSDDENDSLTDVIQSGLRQFYYPPPIQKGGSPHEWSFLEPTTNILVWGTTKSSGTRRIDGLFSGGKTVVTATQDAFEPTMAGKDVEVIYWDEDDTRTATGSFSLGVTTITSTAAIFDRTMVGKDITITDIGTFVIDEHVSPTVVKVKGGETFTSAKTFRVSDLYPIVAVSGPMEITISGGEDFTFRPFTVTSTGDYDLPGEFGAMDSPLTFELHKGWSPIDIAGEGRIRSLRMHSGTAGKPQVAAIRPMRGTRSSSQGHELMIWPTPDTTYKLTYRYKVDPDALVSGADFALGGQRHSETILASCLAVADDRFNDNRGPKESKFIERLAASIAIDLQQGPKRLGFNLDHSDAIADGANRLHQSMRASSLPVIKYAGE